MDVNKILTADVLDILFENKNKSYGAYDLRKTYGKRIRFAMVAMLVFVAVIYALSILGGSVKKKQSQVLVQDVSLASVNEEKQIKKPETPPPPPPKQEPPKVEITKFTPPKIVKDNEVRPDDELKEVNKLADTKLGTINQAGVKDNGLVTNAVAPGAVGGHGGAIEAPKQAKEEDDDKVFTVVQIPAEFPGGTEAWARYLQRNLNRDIPVQNGAPPGRYTVYVTFIVDKTGNISDVHAENDPGYGTKDEAIRVIKRGPKWKPAIQNGRNVIYRHKQGITFQVEEE